jgi:hypothetical protein
MNHLQGEQKVDVHVYNVAAKREKAQSCGSPQDSVGKQRKKIAVW